MVHPSRATLRMEERQTTEAIESQAWLHSSLDAQAVSCYTGEKEISQESECDDENTFCVSRQHMNRGQKPLILLDFLK